MGIGLHKMHHDIMPYTLNQYPRPYPLMPLITMPLTKYCCAIKNSARQGLAVMIEAAISTASRAGRP